MIQKPTYEELEIRIKGLEKEALDARETARQAQEADIAKGALLYADWDNSVPGVQIDRYCASGLDAVNQAASRIACGWEDLIVAGGVESLSRIPLGRGGGAVFNDPDISFRRGLVPQGISADLIAALDGYTMAGRDLRVNEAQERPPRRGGGGGGGGNRDRW